MTEFALMTTNSPLLVLNPTAPQARPSAVSTRTGITRFSIWIRSRIAFVRSTRGVRQ